MTHCRLASAAYIKFLRFGCIGLLNTSLHFFVVIIFVEKILPKPVLANSIAFIVATIFSYIINTNWSFSHRMTISNLLRFLLVSSVGLCLTIFISSIARSQGVGYILATFLVVILVPPVTFLLHFYWTFGEVNKISYENFCK